MIKLLLHSLIYIFVILNMAIAATSTADNDKAIQITSDNLEIIQPDQLAIFSGEVNATHGQLNIKADSMHVYYQAGQNKADKASSTVSKVETKGNVSLITPQEQAESDNGIFDVNNNIITLFGNVALTKGKNVVKGERLVYNVTTGKSSIVSSKKPIDGTKKQRVRGFFMPGG